MSFDSGTVSPSAERRPAPPRPPPPKKLPTSHSTMSRIGLGSIRLQDLKDDIDDIYSPGEDTGIVEGVSKPSTSSIPAHRTSSAPLRKSSSHQDVYSPTPQQSLSVVEADLVRDKKGGGSVESWDAVSSGESPVESVVTSALEGITYGVDPTSIGSGGSSDSKNSWARIDSLDVDPFPGSTSSSPVRPQTLSPSGQSLTTPSHPPPPPNKESPSKAQPKGLSEQTLLIVTNWRFIVATVLLAVSFTGLIPQFLLGVIWGVYGSVLLGLYLLDYLIPSSNESLTASFGGSQYATVSKEDLDRAIAAEVSDTGEKLMYKGWMNELPKRYSPMTYHVNNTRSVLIRIDGATLRLSVPRQNVLKHSCWGDYSVRDSGTFVSTRFFDLTGAQVVLRPRYLAKRRWWSRKYPICIRLKSNALINGVEDEESPKRGEFNKSYPNTDKQDKGNQSNDNFSVSESDDEETEETSEDDTPGRSMDTGAYTSDSPVKESSPVKEKKKKSKQRRKILYLFARSSREKEHWFHRLRQISCRYTFRESQQITATPESLSGVVLRENSGAFNRSRPSSTSSLPTESISRSSSATPLGNDEVFSEATGRGPLSNVPNYSFLPREWVMYSSLSNQYLRYMMSLMHSLGGSSELNLDAGKGTETKSMNLGNMSWRGDLPTYKPIESKESIAWANALAARIFYDFSKDAHWVEAVQDRIQRKLATIHLPYFIETLSLSKLEPGSVPPKITSVYPPILNDWGLWIDLEVEYGGGIRLVLETKINLMKLKSAGLGEEEGTSGSTHSKAQKPLHNLGSPSRFSDEKIPESPESSPDEDASTSKNEPMFGKSATSDNATPLKESTGKRLLGFIDKVVKTETFQQATEMKYVKKFMQGVSDTPLMLVVEVFYVEGTLAINIPPPPSDRLWYAFRRPPKLTLRAQPRVGEKVVGMSHITDWIQSRLRLLLEKNLVIPNMDDVSVPLMSGNPLLNNGYNR